MNGPQLVELGFDICGGQIDYRGKNYGFLTKHGATLTPEGEELAAALAGRQVMAATPPVTEGPRRGRPKKVEEAVVRSAEDVDLDKTISELIGD